MTKSTMNLSTKRINSYKKFAMMPIHFLIQISSPKPLPNN
ncbi:hypothetical protein Zm00014a_005070 [Zea mays]|uniref:Uncharacterized protein n=1 Tax=Zea mays TaxID=4577 RepID=A0A3L6DNA8_MAIZE|nr:hypothetical protein Zm00014a_005070 [Zea mays]